MRASALLAALLAWGCSGDGIPPSQRSRTVDVTIVPDDIAMMMYTPPDALPTRPPDVICGGTSMPLTRRDATVVLVIDRSGSMADPTTDGRPKWTALREALQMALPRIAPHVSIGLTFFPALLPPRDGGGSYLPAEVCTVPTALALEPARNQATPVLERLNLTAPGGPTPTAASLRMVSEWFRTRTDLGGDRYVILATDGGPNCNLTADNTTCRCTGGPQLCDPMNLYAQINCLDAPPAIEAVRALARENVRTFVLGLNGTQDFADVLNEMADAGGRARAGSVRFYPAASATELTRELESITQALADCTLRLDMAPPDPSLVDVRLDGRSLYRDPRRMNGWDWGDETHRQIVFHGPTCMEVQQASGGSQLVAAFGCPAPAPP